MPAGNLESGLGQDGEPGLVSGSAACAQHARQVTAVLPDQAPGADQEPVKGRRQGVIVQVRMQCAGQADPDPSLADPHVRCLRVGQQPACRIDADDGVRLEIELRHGHPLPDLSQPGLQPERRHLLDRLEQARDARGVR